MAVIRHCISLSIRNDEYATNKAEKLFDSILSRYINFLISKDREKEYKKNNKQGKVSENDI